MFKVKEFNQWYFGKAINAISIDSQGMTLISETRTDTKSIQIPWNEVQSIYFESYPYGSPIRDAYNLVIKTAPEAYRFDFSTETATTFPKKKVLSKIRNYYNQSIPVFTYHKLFNSRLYQILTLIVGAVTIWVGIESRKASSGSNSSFIIYPLTLLFALILGSVITYKIEKSTL